MKGCDEAAPVRQTAKSDRLFHPAVIGLGLILAIIFVYAQVAVFDFTTYDDTLYVTYNGHVQAGLTPAGIRWAATAVVASNWMPVTLLSHMLDCQLFHLHSGMHHLVNVGLHFLATFLLFAALRRATGDNAASAFCAFVFALHPLHVESVAWVAERKDVLSACFWFAALYGYVRYAEQPGNRRYLLVAVPFGLGLMAKPMVVTFPFALLLFDAWPLRRRISSSLIREKLPLMALSAVASAVTYSVQGSTGAIQEFPLSVRIENALISYVTYIGQVLWPSGLAVLYPYQPSPALWQAGAAFALLLAITMIVVREWRSRPYLAVGWFWYLGTLVPVIGLVQVGFQSRADRYMYIPMVGLLIMLAWGAADVIARWPKTRLLLRTAAVVTCVVCLVLARAQTGYWRDSRALFERTLEVTRDNPVAEYNFGNYLALTRQDEQAAAHYEAALRLKPAYPEAENNLGMVLERMPGRTSDAIAHFETAVRLLPGLMQAQYNLAAALAKAGRTWEAIQHYEVVERTQPSPEVAKAIEELRGRVK